MLKLSVQVFRSCAFGWLVDGAVRACAAPLLALSTGD
jgi:hypothetical protein